jgi:hypothetical protein
LDPESLSSASELQERLAAASRNEPLAVMVAVTNRHGSFFARYPTGSAPAETQPIRLGCLAKVFTATLACAAAGDGLLSFEGDVRELRGISGKPIFHVLEGLSVAHLLSHTHGLDGTGASKLPQLGDGRIDIETLELACVSARRLAEPGCIYSYGNVGAWLVGALLEHIHGRRYGELIAAFVGSLRGDHVVVGAGAHGFTSTCPSLGGSTEISMTALINFLRLHLGDDLGHAQLKAVAAASNRTRIGHFPVRGWSTEKAVTPGWKFYGDGWYGHSAQLTDWSATLRMNRDKRVGWVLASSPASQFLLRARIFGATMPDVRHLAVPRVLPPERVDPSELDACAGTYESAEHAFAVTRAEGLTLKASLRSQLGLGRIWERETTLLPAGPRLFLAIPAVPEVVHIGQFLGGSSRAEYLWNGSQMFRRSSDHDRFGLLRA